MRRPPQGRLGLPPRRLHLPRLNLARHAALWCGAFTVAGGATIILVDRASAPAWPERQERAAVATMLYGQDDPDSVLAAGLHGLGGRLLPVQITRTAPCRFTLATSATSETVDFSKITVLRYSAIDDTAAVIARAIAGGGRDPPTLQLMILAGSDDAICGPHGCTGHRVFALHDAGRLKAAQAAAAAFRSHACPPR